MNIKKTLRIAAAAALAVSFILSMTFTASAAGITWANQDPVNTQKTDETLVIVLQSEPSSLWMAGSGKMENEMTIIEAALRDELVDVDPNTQEVLPSLATEWEWIDETHCRFTLRDDVIMTDGTPLVADDVVYSINIFMEYSGNSDTGRFFVGAVADDEHTVTVEFNTVAPDLLNLLAWSNYGIFSEDEINALGGVEAACRNPYFGSGKYRFKEWVNGQYILVERNEDYWDPDYAGYFKEIKFTFTNDASARAMQIQSGDAQVAVDMPVTMGASFQEDPNVNFVVNSMFNTARVWYNMGPKAGATSDIRVRQAIDKALDFDAIAYMGTGGLGHEIHGYFLEGSKYYNETFTREEREVDIEGAKALLAEAGYADGLTLSILGTLDAEMLMVVMQENLRQIGIDLQIVIADTAQFVEMANGGDYDLTHLGDSVDVRYPTLMMFFRESFINTFCIGGAKWTTPEIEEKIAALIQTQDPEEAKEIGGELEQIYKENMCFSNTYVELRSALTASDIKGFCNLDRGMMNPTTLYR